MWTFIPRLLLILTNINKDVLMNTQWLMIKQINQHLMAWKKVSEKYGVPKSGWIQTIRKALGMTTQQFADRLGVARSRAAQLEQSEINYSITLHTLKKAADALECELVYAIIPKKSNSTNSLEDIISARAELIAEKRMTRVSHSMALEAQSTKKEFQKDQKKALIKNLREGNLKKLWTNK